LKKLLLILLIILIFIIITTGCSPQEYQVNIETAPEDAGEVVGEGTYEAGEEVELAAIPKEGYDFSSWEMDGEIVSEEQAFKITVDGNKNIRANFEELKYATLEIKEGREVILGPFNKGDEINLEAEEKPGHKFVSWEVDGERASNEKKYDFIMGNKEVYIKAVYEKEVIEENKEEKQEVEETEEKNNADKILEEKLNKQIILVKEQIENEEWSRVAETLKNLKKDGIRISDTLIKKLEENKVMSEARFLEIVDKYEKEKPENLTDEILSNDEKLFNWIKDYYRYYIDLKKELADAFDGDEYLLIFNERPTEYVHYFTGISTIWSDNGTLLTWYDLDPDENSIGIATRELIDWPYEYKEVELKDFSLGNFEDLKLNKAIKEMGFLNNHIYVNLKYNEDYSSEDFNYDFDVPEQNIGDIRILIRTRQQDDGTYKLINQGISFLILAEKETE